MLSRESVAEFIKSVKEKAGEEITPLINEDLLNFETLSIASMDRILELEKENEILREDKEKLIKANNNLFQKLSFTNEDKKESDEVEVELKIDELFNEKGELI